MGFIKISEDTEQMVFDAIGETGLHNFIDFKVIGTTKSKQLIKVKKTSAETDFVAGVADCVTVIIYEEAFDRLSEEQKRFLIEDALNTVGYDSEKERVLIGCPQISVTCGGRRKYGEELLNAAECGVMMMEAVEQEKKEAKERAKESKKNG